MQSLPSRRQDQSCSLGPLAMNGCGLFGILRFFVLYTLNPKFHLKDTVLSTTFELEVISDGHFEKSSSLVLKT